MSRIGTFIYCLDAERKTAGDGGDIINAMGVLSAITPEFVPGTFSFSIIFSVLDIDISKSNKIKVVFANYEKHSIIDTGEIQLPIMPNQSSDVDLPNEYKGLNMSMDFRNAVLEKEGIYYTQIYFNNELLGENPIYVKGKRNS